MIKIKKIKNAREKRFLHKTTSSVLFVLSITFFILFSAKIAVSETDYQKVLNDSWNHFKTYKISQEGQVWSDEDGSDARVFSESQSYGMLRAAWMNDQESFDKIWNWTKNNLQRNNLEEMYFWNEQRWITPADSAWQQKVAPRQDYLIAWRWLKNADGSGKEGIIYYDYINSTDEWKDGFDAATDADEDIALALVFADSRMKKGEWQPNFDYLQDAKNIVSSIWDREVFLLNPNMLDDFRDVMEWGSWQSCDGSDPGCGAWAIVSQSPNPNKMKLSYYKPSNGYAGAGTSLYRDLNNHTGMIVSVNADKSTQLRVQLQDNQREMFEKTIILSTSPQQFIIPFSQFTSRTDYQPPDAVIDGYLELMNVSSLTFEIVSSGSGDIYFYNVSIYGPNEYPKNYYMSAGDKFPMINGINPSYLAPYEYRIFDEIDDNPAHNWSDVIKTSYRIIKESGNTSLVPFAGQLPARGVNMPPNWVGLDDYGSIINNEWWYNDIHFNYKYWDAFRTLWRISLDYYWYNSTDAYDYIKQNSPYGPNNFLRNELSAKGYISTRYYYNGTVAYTPGDKQHYFGIDAVYASFFAQAGSTQEAQALLNSVDSEWSGETWGNETYNYYGVNWAWFGTALAINNLPNIYNDAKTGCSSSAEVCDMIDNDCDGIIDEDVVCYNPSCYDSDDGKKYYTKAYLDFQLNPWRNLDWCSNGTALKEYYCNDQGFSAHVSYDCPYGCWDGACIMPNGTVCTNSAEICDGIDNNCDGQADENRVCNRAPWIGDGSINALLIANQSFRYWIYAYDPDHDPLFFEWKIDGASYSTEKSFNFTPTASMIGNHAMKINISDGLKSDPIISYNATFSVMALEPRGPDIEKCDNTANSDYGAIDAKQCSHYTWCYDEDDYNLSKKSKVWENSRLNPYEDFCSDETLLNEYVCKPDSYGNPRVVVNGTYCPYKCINGSCIERPPGSNSTNACLEYGRFECISDTSSRRCLDWDRDGYLEWSTSQCRKDSICNDDAKSCIKISCSKDSDCINDFVEGPYCGSGAQSNILITKYHDNFCQNPGTAQARCWFNITEADNNCGNDALCAENKCAQKIGCQYNNPLCENNEECVNNICIPKQGCQYNNPACSANQECINNQCAPKQGCQHNNPSCGINYTCVNNQCALKSGCEYSNPACPLGQICDPFNKCITPACVKDSDCGSAYELTRMCGSGEKNNSVIRTEKQFYCANPGSWMAICMFRFADATAEVCGQGARCRMGECENTGCAYSNPNCPSGFDCINNQCTLKQGCKYNNPLCQPGYACQNNECVAIANNFPDVFIKQSYFALQPKLNKQATLKIVVANKGAANANGITWLLSTAEKSYKSISEFSLKPGEERDIFLKFTLRKPGEQSVWFALDPENEIQESDETNNRVNFTITI